MNLKRNMGLIVGLAVLGLALAGTAGWLFLLVQKYQKVQDEVSNLQQQHSALVARSVFPSDKNLKVLKANLQLTEQTLAQLQASLGRTQVNPVKMEAADFSRHLSGWVKLQRAKARQAKWKVDAKYAFGFERYYAGQIPAENDIPRLTIQMQQIAALCDVLADCKVTELARIERVVFEKGAGETTVAGRHGVAMTVQTAAPADGAVPLEPAEAQGLYTRERYQLELVAAESTVWQLLNRLAGSSTFTVVKKIELDNPTQPVSAAVGGGATNAPAMDRLPRDQRIAAGGEQVRVIMELDVLRIANAQTAGAAR